MKKEYADYKWFIKTLKKLHKPIKIQRIETAAQDGLPDMFIRTPLYDNWLEFKHITKIGRRTPTKLKFQPGQLLWLKQYMKLGGRAWLVIISDIGTLVIIKGEQIADIYWSESDVYMASALYTKLPGDCGEEIYSLLNSEY